MRFGEAYEIAENGGFITRTSWDGTFIWLKPKAKVKSEWCRDPVLKMIADSNGGEVEAEQMLCKYSLNDRKVISGWLPEQNDLAADDWSDTYVKMDGKDLVMKVLKKKEKDEYAGDLFDGIDIFKKP